MRVDDWLTAAVAQLQAAKVATSRLDALVLLADATHKGRSWLLAHPEFALSKPQQNVLNGWLGRRQQHEPLAYIRGKSEFYGREFVVSPAVLIPRPETETMLDLLQSYTTQSAPSAYLPEHTAQQLTAALATKRLQIIDVGTGSGALAISAALTVPTVNVWGLDIDPNCLEIAQENATLHDVKITLAQSNLLADVSDTTLSQPTILLSNLPYVPDDYTINQAAQHEPALALFAGPDGLDLYRQLFQQLAQRPQQPLLILTEALLAQHLALRELAQQYGYQQVAEADFIQVFSY